MFPRVLHKITLDTNFRMEVSIGITNDQRYVFFPNKTQLFRLDLKTGSIRPIINLVLEDLYLDSDVIFFLGSSGENRLLVWTSTDGQILGSVKLDNSISVSISYNTMFLGIDSKIFSIDVVNR